MTLIGETAVCDRYKWRCTIHDSIKTLQEQATSWANVMCAVRKGEIIDPATHQFICDACDRVRHFNAGLVTQKCNIGTPFINYYDAGNIQGVSENLKEPHRPDQSHKTPRVS